MKMFVAEIFFVRRVIFLSCYFFCIKHEEEAYTNNQQHWSIKSKRINVQNKILAVNNFPYFFEGETKFFVDIFLCKKPFFS